VLSPTPQRRCIARLGQHWPYPRPAQLVGDVQPPGARLDHELSVVDAGEPLLKPCRQMRPVGRRDLAPRHLIRGRVHIVEGQLLTVHVQRAYNPHRDLLKLRE
jgi:hypothetical protein